MMTKDEAEQFVTWLEVLVNTLITTAASGDFERKRSEYPHEKLVAMLTKDT